MEEWKHADWRTGAQHLFHHHHNLHYYDLHSSDLTISNLVAVLILPLVVVYI